MLTFSQAPDDMGFYQQALNGSFTDGSPIHPGHFQVLVRSLRVYGDPANEGDYDQALSEDFIIED